MALGNWRHDPAGSVEKTLSNMVEVKSVGLIDGTDSYGNYSIEDMLISQLCSETEEILYTRLATCAAAADGILCQRC